MSKTPTMRAMKDLIVLKLRRPILQEPSTSSTMSAFALVLHDTSDNTYGSESASNHVKLYDSAHKTICEETWTEKR